MDISKMINILGSDFFVGVPDSQLKDLCSYLLATYGTDPKHHIIAANEGNCAAIAAGYHLATGKYPVVYMQNSGEGNIINPAASLLNKKVYGIPVIFIIGWRGEPGIHDEPQHIYQGEITLKLLDVMGIRHFVIDKETSDETLEKAFEDLKTDLEEGKDIAFVVKKGALSGAPSYSYKNSYSMTREEVIRHITEVSGNDPIVSTTGKASRELFEIREAKGQGHKYDFLTVGSMGHSSSIALGVALQKEDKKVWCIDGDGALLMHMGAAAIIGSIKPKNLVHVVINNEAHESVGGMPTVSGSADLVEIAKACGYQKIFRTESYDELDKVLAKAKDSDCLTFIEARCAIGARADLGRPTTTAVENKEAFMAYLKEE